MKWKKTWEIESGSSGKTYRVSIADDGTLGCSCPRWKFAKHPKPACKHITIAKEDYHSEIVDAINAYEIPLSWDEDRRDFVKDFTDMRPLCTNPTEKRKKCNAYDGGRCDDEAGPCEAYKATKKSLAEELDEALDEIDDFTDEELGHEPQTVMSLIAQNAQWRI
jgi:hypothetical protein